MAGNEASSTVVLLQTLFVNLGRQWTLVFSSIYSKTFFVLFSHWSSHRRISSSSTVSAASNDLSRDYSFDTQEVELQREDLISQGALPVSVITQGRLPSPIPSYRHLHNDLPSAVSTMVDESLFTSLCEFD